MMRRGTKMKSATVIEAEIGNNKPPFTGSIPVAAAISLKSSVSQQAI
jgi:hypothetical protein